MQPMINRDQLRLEKQRECDDKIAALYLRLPLLQQIDQAIGQKNITMIRVGVLQKNKQQKEALQKEIEALMEQRHRLLQENGLDESIYEPNWNCPKCQDRGYIEPGVLCSCYQQERLQELFSRSGMPDSMRQKTFANFDSSYYEDDAKIEDKIRWCKQFAWQITQGSCPQSLFLTGGVGRGKTHLSAAIANTVLEQGCVVIYRRAADLFDLLRQCRFEESRQKCSEVLEQLRSCDLLVIDDLGAERTTDFVIEQLVMLLEDRNAHDKAWIISSNLNINEIAAAYNDRTADRILDRAMLFKLNRASSIRQDQAAIRFRQL